MLVWTSQLNTFVILVSFKTAMKGFIGFAAFLSATSVTASPLYVGKNGREYSSHPSAIEMRY